MRGCCGRSQNGRGNVPITIPKWNVIGRECASRGGRDRRLNCRAKTAAKALESGATIPDAAQGVPAPKTRAVAASIAAVSRSSIPSRYAFSSSAIPNSRCRQNLVQPCMDDARASAGECVPDDAPLNEVRSSVDRIVAMLHQHTQAVAATWIPNFADRLMLGRPVRHSPVSHCKLVARRIALGKANMCNLRSTLTMTRSAQNGTEAAMGNES